MLLYHLVAKKPKELDNETSDVYRTIILVNKFKTNSSRVDYRVIKVVLL